MLEAYREAGGEGPCYAEVALCCAASEEAARATAHKYFRWSLAGWPVMAELPDPAAFAAASAQVTPEAVARAISCGPSVERHLAAIERYVEAGFDHVVLTQIGPDQAFFLDLFERRLGPALRARVSS